MTRLPGPGKRTLLWCLGVFRPFGVALAIFIFLNLLLAIQKPSLSATRIWLYLKIPEPVLSGCAAILGLALIWPRTWAVRPGTRAVIAGILCGFLILVAMNIVSFYLAMNSGRMLASFPVPFSALIALILAGEMARVLWNVPRRSRGFLIFSRIMLAISVPAAFFVLILAHIVTFGFTDYAPAARTADAAVVLGARVYPDGTLSNALLDRLETGMRLHREKRVRYLILSGGIDPSGVSEPRAMAAHARRNGIPDSHLILDEKGADTYQSALSCQAIARERNFKKLIVVSQYFHNARVKLIFERVGVSCFTVPARYRRLVREGYFLFREAIAFPFYYLYYR